MPDRETPETVTRRWTLAHTSVGTAPVGKVERLKPGERVEVVEVAALEAERERTSCMQQKRDRALRDVESWQEAERRSWKRQRRLMAEAEGRAVRAEAERDALRDALNITYTALDKIQDNARRRSPRDVTDGYFAISEDARKARHDAIQRLAALAGGEGDGGNGSAEKLAPGPEGATGVAPGGEGDDDR